MTCMMCGAELPVTSTLYDARGNAICVRCLLATQTGAERHPASSMTVKSLAYGGPVLGVAGMFFNPVLVMSIAAIVNGVYVLRAIRHPDTAAHLEDSLEKVKVGAIAGVVLGGITAVLTIMSFTSK